MRNGVAYAPIPLEGGYGPVVLFFQADRLTTDLSGLRLVQDAGYDEAVARCKQILEDARTTLKWVEQFYQPAIDRKAVVKQAVGMAVSTPVVIAGVLALGGAPLLLKYALTWQLTAGITAAATLRELRHLPNPEGMTERERREKLAWVHALP